MNVRKRKKVVEELVEEIENLVGTMNARESKVDKVVKPAKVSAWTEKMSLRTCEKVLEVGIHQNRDMDENGRFHEVMESLKLSKVRVEVKKKMDKEKE